MAKKAKFVPIEDHEEELSYMPYFYEGIFYQDMQQALNSFLSLLDTRSREIIRLKYNEGYTLREIGRIYGVHYETIRGIIYRGIRDLRKHPNINDLTIFLEDNWGNEK